MYREIQKDRQRNQEAVSSKTERRRKGFAITASTLKIIAVITMLVDHVAAIVLVKWMISRNVLEIIDYEGGRVMSLLTGEYGTVLDIYMLMRNVGRLAFPIYCFLLVEGFLRTRNVRKYLGRMFVLALLSEVPFDLAFSGAAFYWGYQNVIFTLFLALAAMYVCSMVADKVENTILRLLVTAAIWGGAAVIAELMQTDYSAKGVLCIAVLYLLRNTGATQLLGGAIAFVWEMPASLAFLPIALYKGEKGRSLKGFFYGFYPIHILILYLICLCMGMGHIPVI